jgi:histone H3/H4
MLQFTRRVIQEPPIDRLSKDMLIQAERIQAEIAELFSKLEALPKMRKTNKKQRVKKKGRK